MARLDFTTPVGRFVGGSIYKPETTDYYGKPLTAKDNVTPRVDYQIAIAIPKTPGVQHWSHEEWGKPIWAHAHAEFKNNEPQRADFSWKIVDGDSTVPNKRNHKPCDREGYKGHWVVWFSGGFAPTVYNHNGSATIGTPDAVLPGDMIQIFGNVQGNGNLENPGIYINHTYVALNKTFTRITMGPDVSAAKFGEGVTLPAYAEGAPAGNFTPAPPADNAGTGLPPPPPNTATANVEVAPNPAILDAPVAPPPPPPAAPAGKQLTAKGAGQTYEAMIKAGWTDATLIQHGYLNP